MMTEKFEYFEKTEPIKSEVESVKPEIELSKQKV
jgi:hypothetical protein